MPDIVLTTLNAKYIHTAFGLRYLLANLGALQPRAAILEFDLNQRPVDIAEAVLAQKPRIVGFGIYIWNVGPTTETIAVIKRLRPDIKIVLGGPEVSYEAEEQPVVRLADHVIAGEADLRFAEVCQVLLGERAPAPSTRRTPLDCTGRGTGAPALPKIIPAELPDFSRLALPYPFYTDEDVAHRIIYVEASRGCPFTCEFCLSSLDIPVRQVPVSDLLSQLQQLLDRGVKQFKFVDRTFNLNLKVSRTILEFLRQRCQPGHFFHFEMVPDRLPQALRDVIAQFPPGALQFEVGVQTFNENVGALIKRRQQYARLEENLRFLRNHTGVHLHADLIAGLPGETLESFAAGFDRLVRLRPHEIQVGILKRLRGTPIVRYDTAWEMVYSPQPPYELLGNKLIDFPTMQKVRRFARYWDLVGNSGNFIETTPLIWSRAKRGSSSTPSATTARNRQAGLPEDAQASPFFSFMRWSEWLYRRVGRTDRIALIRLMELLFEFLIREQGHGKKEVAAALWRDYQRGGRSDKPAFLKELLVSEQPLPVACRRNFSLPKRQSRHHAATPPKGFHAT